MTFKPMNAAHTHGAAARSFCPHLAKSYRSNPMPDTLTRYYVAPGYDFRTNGAINAVRHETQTILVRNQAWN